MIMDSNKKTHSDVEITDMQTDVPGHAKKTDLGNDRVLSAEAKADCRKESFADKFIVRQKIGSASLVEDRQTGKNCLIRPLADFLQPDVAGLLKLIRHPGIPQIYDIWTPDLSDESLPQSLIIYEYIPGPTLREKINQRSSQDKFKTANQRKQIKQMLQWLLQGAGILSFLHCQQNRALLHLDIKPENIVISHQRLTLIDFSVARFDLPEFDQPVFDHIKDESLNYTPAYAGPEMLKGQPCPASDVFSLALSMLEWISGASVTACRNQTTTIINQALPDMCHDLFTACLASDPTARPDTAGELIEQTRHLIETFNSPDRQNTWLRQTINGKQRKRKQIERIDTIQDDGKKHTLSNKQKLSNKLPLSDKQIEPIADNDTSPLLLKRQLPRKLTIFGDAAFGCELATVIAKSSPVLIIEADWFNPHSDQLLSLDKDENWLAVQNKTAGLDQALSDIRSGQMSTDRLRALCETGEHKQIWVLTPKRDLHYYEQYRSEDFQTLISMASQVFSTIMILVNTFIYDLYTCLSLMISDQVLIPVKGSKPSILARQRAINFLRQKNILTQDNLFYVAYPYEKEYDLSWHSMQAATHSRTIGLISETKERRLLSNGNNSYCHVLSKKNKSEYLRLLKNMENAFNVSIQPKVVE